MSYQKPRQPFQAWEVSERVEKEEFRTMKKRKESFVENHQAVQEFFLTAEEGVRSFD